MLRHTDQPFHSSRASCYCEASTTQYGRTERQSPVRPYAGSLSGRESYLTFAIWLNASVWTFFGSAT